MGIKDYNTKHTIAAIATFPSVSALGVIKVSGKGALHTVGRIFLPKQKNKDINRAKSYTLHYGWIIQPQTADYKAYTSARTLQANRRPPRIIDEVLVSIMRAPHSYTREDVVEISSHGGILILNKILKALLKGGARLAKPGEFSYRAFLSGRLDLTQVQAIGDIVEAKTDKAMFSLSRQLKGDFSSNINFIKDELKNVLSLLEAYINFPEDDIEIDLINVKNTLEKISGRIKNIIDKRNISKVLREGIRCVICGRANVGKSTLFNCLLKEEKAIVTSIAGTTRDAVEEIINVRGLPLRIYDTAGILKAKDFLDKSAMKKSYEKIDNADLIIFMFDASGRVDKKSLSLLEKIKDKDAILVINKIDLTPRVNVTGLRRFKKPIVKISALKNIGLDRLEKTIFNVVYKKGLRRQDNIVILASWQAQLLESILSHVDEAEKLIRENFSIDFVSLAVKNALSDICKLTGEEIDEEILNGIFSNFCIGK